MWLVEIFSEGDLNGETYIYTRHEEIIQDKETGKYYEHRFPRYKDADDIVDRLEFIDSCLERLKSEKKFLLNNAQEILEWNREYYEVDENGQCI